MAKRCRSCCCPSGRTNDYGNVCPCMYMTPTLIDHHYGGVPLGYNPATRTWTGCKNISFPGSTFCATPVSTAIFYTLFGDNFNSSNWVLRVEWISVGVGSHCPTAGSCSSTPSAGAFGQQAIAINCCGPTIWNVTGAIYPTSGGVASQTVTFPCTTVSGILRGCPAFGGIPGTITIKDSAGNTYVNALPTDASGNYQAFFMLTSNTTLTVTGTPSSSRYAVGSFTFSAVAYGSYGGINVSAPAASGYVCTGICPLPFPTVNLPTVHTLAGAFNLLWNGVGGTHPGRWQNVVLGSSMELFLTGQLVFGGTSQLGQSKICTPVPSQLIYSSAGIGGVSTTITIPA